MMKVWVHSVYRDDAWITLVEGEGIDSRHRTEQEAVSRGRELALRRGAEHVIHNRDGTIAAVHSYSPHISQRRE